MKENSLRAEYREAQQDAEVARDVVFGEIGDGSTSPDFVAEQLYAMGLGMKLIVSALDEAEHSHVVDTEQKAEPYWMKVGEVADYLNVSVATVRRWSNEGLLPTYRMPSEGGSQGARIYRAKDVKSLYTLEEQ